METLTYLQPEELQLLLLEWGYTKVVDAQTLIQILAVLEQRIDSWLGYRIAPTAYEANRMSNVESRVFLPNYPVIEVSKIRSRLQGVIGEKPIWIDVLATWEGGNTIFVPAPYTRYYIDYIAGYDPIPPQIKSCMAHLLKNFFETSSEISPNSLIAFSSTPYRDLTSVSLPGGLSQSFRLPQSENIVNTGVLRNRGTELDRALQPLMDLKVRRQTIL